jgi:predicted PurR-regulated permease PerM
MARPSMALLAFAGTVVVVVVSFVVDSIIRPAMIQHRKIINLHCPLSIDCMAR